MICDCGKQMIITPREDAPDCIVYRCNHGGFSFLKLEKKK